MSWQYSAVYIYVYHCIRSIVDHIPVSLLVWYVPETTAYFKTGMFGYIDVI
jgi:hypothetical protein